MEDLLESFSPRQTGRAQHVSDGRDYLNAIARLPVSVLQKALRHLGRSATLAARDTFHGLRPLFVDGSTSRLSRTASNKKAFKSPSNQHEVEALPLLRWLVLCGSGAVLDTVFGSYTSSESRMFISVLLRLEAGCVVVGDAAFGSYLGFCLAQERGSHMLCALSDCRKSRYVQALGRKDELHLWTRPDWRHTSFPHLLAGQPPELYVRIVTWTVRRKGCKPYTLRLVTTLLDERKYRRRELVKLYLRRWNIETMIGALKTRHGLSALKSQSPKAVAREFYAGLLAFNAVKALQAQTRIQPRKLSHVRCTAMILSTAQAMPAAPNWKLPVLYEKLLKRMAAARLKPQKRPTRPRARVWTDRRYPPLQNRPAA